jgi:peptidyl-tRNA hydrolase
VKKQLFNDPKKMFEALVKPLSTLANEIESLADAVLAKEDQERIADINQVLDGYKAKFQQEYALDESLLTRIEYKKNYYNKTAKEKARKDDLEAQFKELKKEQDTYAANIRLIEFGCKDDPRLNAAHWVDQLQYEGIATIIVSIEQEKKRLAELDKSGVPVMAETETEAETETKTAIAPDEKAVVDKVVLGVIAGLDLASDFPGREKSITIKLTYPCDLGDALTELFKRLREHGVKCKVSKETAF